MRPGRFTARRRAAALMNLGRRAPRGPRQRIWGLGELTSCCSMGALDCCNLIANLQKTGTGWGFDAGLGANEGVELLDKVKKTLSMMPGGSKVVATAEKVQAVYDVATGRKADELDREYKNYKDKVSGMNSALRKLDRILDRAEREQAFADYRQTAESVGQYGLSLIEEIREYNQFAEKIESLSLGKVKPRRVSTAGLIRIDVPTMSAFGDLGYVQAVIIVGIIAVVLLGGMSLLESYMHYDLKRKGVKEGMERQYEGLMGKIKQKVDVAGGNILTVALIGGAGVAAFFLLKKYLKKKKQQAAAVEAVEEITTVAEGA